MWYIIDQPPNTKKIRGHDIAVNRIRENILTHPTVVRTLPTSSHRNETRRFVVRVFNFVLLNGEKYATDNTTVSEILFDRAARTRTRIKKNAHAHTQKKM